MNPVKVKRIQELMDRLERLEETREADARSVDDERRTILEEIRRIAGPGFTIYRNGGTIGAVSLAG